MFYVEGGIFVFIFLIKDLWIKYVRVSLCVRIWNYDKEYFFSLFVSV